MGQTPGEPPADPGHSPARPPAYRLSLAAFARLIETGSIKFPAWQVEALRRIEDRTLSFRLAFQSPRPRASRQPGHAGGDGADLVVIDEPIPSIDEPR